MGYIAEYLLASSSKPAHLIGGWLVQSEAAVRSSVFLLSEPLARRSLSCVFLSLSRCFSVLNDLPPVAGGSQAGELAHMLAPTTATRARRFPPGFTGFSGVRESRGHDLGGMEKKENTDTGGAAPHTTVNLLSSRGGGGGWRGGGGGEKGEGEEEEPSGQRLVVMLLVSKEKMKAGAAVATARFPTFQRGVGGGGGEGNQLMDQVRESHQQHRLEEGGEGGVVNYSAGANNTAFKGKRGGGVLGGGVVQADRRNQP